MTNKDLEDKFSNILEQAKIAQKQIEDCLANAKNELRVAEAIAEKYGVPFLSCVSEFVDRGYKPASFMEKWRDVPKELIPYDIEDYDRNYKGESGWEYWNSSSMSC